MDENRYHYLVIGQVYSPVSNNTLTVNLRVQLADELNPVNLNDVYAQLESEMHRLVSVREARTYTRTAILSVVPLGKHSSEKLLRMRKEASDG